MNERDLHELLKAVEAGKVSPEKAVQQLKHLPFEDLGFAKVDHHRALRQGYAEVVFGKGKTPQQVTDIVRSMLRHGTSGHKTSRQNILVTRADKKTFAAVRRVNSGIGRAAKFHPLSGVITIERTAEIYLYDVGVAGIHRLLEHRAALTSARVVICIAGMEGALPSVVGGLVAAPVIAVPTSVGYGASFGGVAALLGMLNSCASNVTVVNIDNGFGAACVASCINRV